MTDELRTKIAQIIDNRGWAMPLMGDEDSALDQPYQRHCALKKADAILALVSPPPVEGGRVSQDHEQPITAVTSRYTIYVKRTGDKRKDWSWSWRDGADRGVGFGFPSMRDACLDARKIFGHNVTVVDETSSSAEQSERDNSWDTQNPSPPSPVEGETLWADAEKCAADQGGEQDA